MNFQLLDTLDRYFAVPFKNPPKLSLRTLKFFYSWTCVFTIWYIFFASWFIRGAGYIYAGGTICFSLILMLAFFYESDGRRWQQFVKLCLFCSIFRLFVFPIYAVANMQTTSNGNTVSVNGTMVPSYHETFHMTAFMGHMDSDIKTIWFVHYYNFMLIIVSIQRVYFRKAVEEKKARIYAETVKNDELKNVHNEQGVGPIHM